MDRDSEGVLREDVLSLRQLVYTGLGILALRLVHWHCQCQGAPTVTAGSLRHWHWRDFE
jgi:hypothetical protein